MLPTKRPPITRYDYELMREGPPYYQLIDGDLVMAPSPSTTHQDVVGRVYAALTGFLENNPMGRVFISPLDVYLSELNVYQPDVIFVSNHGQATVTERGIEGAPDLVIEVLSPTTAAYDKGSKRKVYARCGVQELWIVDPAVPNVQVYNLGKDAETPWATHGAKGIVRSTVLPGIKVKTAILFRNPTGQTGR